MQLEDSIIAAGDYKNTSGWWAGNGWIYFPLVSFFVNAAPIILITNWLSSAHVYSTLFCFIIIKLNIWFILICMINMSEQNVGRYTANEDTRVPYLDKWGHHIFPIGSFVRWLVELQVKVKLTNSTFWYHLIAVHQGLCVNPKTNHHHCTSSHFFQSHKRRHFILRCRISIYL